MQCWPLQDAKAKFSELVNKCLTEGPQMVTRRGAPAVVIIPATEYEKTQKKRESLKDFLLRAPRVELDVERAKDLGRDIDL